MKYWAWLAVLSVMFVYGAASARADDQPCEKTRSKGPFSGGKFQPASANKILFHFKLAEDALGGSDNYDVTVYETGKIRRNGEAEAAIAATIHYEYEGPGGGEGYYFARYAVGNGVVRRFSRLADPPGADSKVMSEVEKRLRNIFKAKTVVTSADSVEGLGLPQCRITISGEKWTAFGPRTPLADSIHVVPAAKNPGLPKDLKIWIGDVDPLMYAETPDHLFVSYTPERAFAFDHAGVSYSCSDDPSKRDSSTLQERHHIEAGISSGNLREVWKDKTFGSVFEGKGKLYNSDLGQFYQEYEYRFRSLREDQNADQDQDERSTTDRKKLTRDQMASKHPVVYVRDAFSRYYLCEAKDLLPDISKFVEPLIYIYSTTSKPITVTLGENVKVMGADPLPVRNSWTVTSDPAGQLRMSRRKYGSLFWEGRGTDFPAAPRAGVALLSSQVEEYLSSTLPRLGLSRREVTEFLHYWVPVLDRFPAVLIDFMVNDEVEHYVPLSVSRTMPLLRVYLTYRPLDPGEIGQFSRKAYPRIKRPAGDLLVEWGGVHWADQLYY